MYTENRFPTARFKAKFKIEIIYNCNTCSEDLKTFININCNISMSFRLLTCSKAPIIECPDNSLWLWSSLQVQTQTCKSKFKYSCLRNTCLLTSARSWPDPCCCVPLEWGNHVLTQRNFFQLLFYSWAAKTSWRILLWCVDIMLERETRLGPISNNCKTNIYHFVVD